MKQSTLYFFGVSVLIVAGMTGAYLMGSVALTVAVVLGICAVACREFAFKDDQFFTLVFAVASFASVTVAVIASNLSILKSIVLLAGIMLAMIYLAVTRDFGQSAVKGKLGKQ